MLCRFNCILNLDRESDIPVVDTDISSFRKKKKTIPSRLTYPSEACRIV